MNHSADKIKHYFSDWTAFEKTWLIVSAILIVVLYIIWGESLISLISALTGIISVVLCAKGKISNYAFGIVNALTYAWVSYAAHLYGEAMYNTIFMVPMIIIGIITWKKNMNESEVKARNLSLKGWVITIASTVLAVLIYRQILFALGGNLTWIDASSTVISVIATILMVMRYTEQWVMWIVVNGISVVMWLIVVAKGDMSNITTVIMWSAYLLNSSYGFSNWRKMAKATN